MGVYIKGMDMPKCDIDCPIFTEEICPVESVLALSKMKEERPPDCPLVPVPPHGRCIDADALIKELAIDDLDDKTGATLLMAVFLEVLKAAPTIIPAEED